MLSDVLRDVDHAGRFCMNNRRCSSPVRVSNGTAMPGCAKDVKSCHRNWKNGMEGFAIRLTHPKDAMADWTRRWISLFQLDQPNRPARAQGSQQTHRSHRSIDATLDADERCWQWLLVVGTADGRGLQWRLLPWRSYLPPRPCPKNFSAPATPSMTPPTRPRPGPLPAKPVLQTSEQPPLWINPCISTGSNV